MPDKRGKALVAFMVIYGAFCFLLSFGLLAVSADKASASDDAKEQCEKWCKTISVCKCTSVKGCGKGGEAIRSFKGKDQRWYACRFESDLQAWNKKDCDAYCSRNPKVCASCNDAKGCGPGVAVLKTFRYGNRTHLDYYACKKK